MQDLSIAIVIYKNYEEVMATIESIEQYTVKKINKTIYIVDNSDDEDESLRDEFKRALQKFPDVSYRTKNQNLGFGAANNLVLEELDSKYHAIVNPDITIQEDAFAELITYMEKESTVGMVIPRMLSEDGQLQEAYRREVTISDMFIRMFIPFGFKKRQQYHKLTDQNYDEPFHVPFGQGSFLMIRTELFRQLGGFDDRYFMYMEDADLCKRVNEISELRYCPYATVIHKWEKGSHKNKKLFRIHLESMLKYFQKWGFKFK